MKWEQNHRVPKTYINNEYRNVIQFTATKSKQSRQKTPKTQKDERLDF